MHRYQLQPYKGKSTRHTCPSCSKPNEFTRYIDNETGEYIHKNVGKCNREVKCGYHYKPGEYYQENPNQRKYDNPGKAINTKKEENNKSQPISYIDYSILQKSTIKPETNNLIKYLHKLLNPETVMHLCNIYHIGTSKYHGGGTTVFWQVDCENRVRSGKLIHYDPITGHRDKTRQTTWVHAIHTNYRKPREFNLHQCLFGEHLLKEDPNSPVALVESEKTAIIAMARMPHFLWLATGSLNEFKPAKLNVLEKRKVIAFPDLGAYEKWEQKAGLLRFRIQVSDYLERNASEKEREMGLDIGDYLAGLC